MKRQLLSLVLLGFLISENVGSDVAAAADAPPPHTLSSDELAQFEAKVKASGMTEDKLLSIAGEVRNVEEGLLVLRRAIMSFSLETLKTLSSTLPNFSEVVRRSGELNNGGGLVSIAVGTDGNFEQIVFLMDNYDLEITTKARGWRRGKVSLLHYLSRVSDTCRSFTRELIERIIPGYTLDELMQS